MFVKLGSTETLIVIRICVITFAMVTLATFTLQPGTFFVEHQLLHYGAIAMLAYVCAWVIKRVWTVTFMVSKITTIQKALMIAQAMRETKLDDVFAEILDNTAREGNNSITLELTQNEGVFSYTVKERS